MGEIKNPENSGVSDPSGDEQNKNEEEDNQEAQVEDVTSVIEPKEESEDVLTDESTDANETAPVDEPEVPEEVMEEEKAEDETPNGADGASTDAIDMAKAVSVSVIQYDRNDLDEDKNPNETDDAVEVHYIEGVDNGQAAGGDIPVKFRVEAKDGWNGANGKITVAYDIVTINKDGEEEIKTSPLNASSDVYTITPTAANAEDKTDKKKYFTGDITIKVTAERIQPKLLAAAGTDAWLTDEEHTKITSSGIAQEFSLFQEEVSIAVDAKDVDPVTAAVKIGDNAANAAVPCVRTEDTVAIGPEGNAKEYPVYTFDPAALEGFEENTTNASLSFIITKEEGTETTLSLAVDSERGTAYNVKQVGAGANLKDTEDIHYIQPTGDNTMPSSTFTKSDYQKTGEKDNVLAFEVTAGDNREITAVKAVLTKAGDDAFSKEITPGTATYETSAGDEAVEVTYYTVALSEIAEEDFDANLTLTIEATTAFKSAEDDFAVHNITFAGDTANVEIKENSSGTAITDGATFDAAKDMSLAFSTNEDTLYFAIKAKDGYEIAYGKDFNPSGTSKNKVVTVSYEKTYEVEKTDAGADDEPTKITKVVSEEQTLDEIGNESDVWKLTTNLVLGDSTGDQEWYDELGNDEKTEYTQGNKAYSLKNVVITIGTESESNQKGRFIVEADEGLDYSVVTGNGVEATEVAGAYEISEEASFVTLNITSAGKPEVEYLGTNGMVPATVAESEGSYRVSIPVAKLHGAQAGSESTNSNINSRITIRKATKTFDVKYVGDSDFDGDIKIKNNNRELYTDGMEGTTQNQGDVIPVTLYAKAGTEFKSVKVKVGEAEPTDVSLGEDKSQVQIDLTLSDNVHVIVDTNNVYGAALTFKQGSEVKTAYEAEDGVYDIPVGSTDITATLKLGDDTANIEYAKFYDGSAVAASKVTVAGATATIKKIDEKDTGVLRLDLTAKVKNKLTVVASLQIRQEKMAEELAIVDEWSGEEQTSLTLEPDSKAITYKVVAKDGSLAFSNSTILLELTEDETKAGTLATDNKDGTYTVRNKNKDIEATYDTSDRTLTIKALPSIKGGYKGILRFYDADKRRDKKIADNICKVGQIAVETTEPSLNNATLNVTGLNHTNTTLKLQVNSDAAQPVGGNGNKVFYRVSFPAEDKSSFGDAKLYGDKYFLLTEGSQVLEIPVNPNTMKAGKDDVPYSKPATYHPTVSLVQTTVALADGVPEEVVAKQDKKTWIEKTADPIEATTKEARFEHSLMLTPAKATVYTGAKSALVTKAVFSDGTGFAEITKLEFVNTKTGVKRGSDHDYNGLNATSGKDGSVYISATRAEYDKNYPDQFKDLGLKVTAQTSENTMPASKVLPLTVVAGVNSISFENGYQQSIYKQPGKAASLQIKAVLNEGKKETAPKKKKFVYALGDASGKLPGQDGYDKPSYQVTNYVTVNAKNGKVAVNKNFEVDEKDASNNKFSVVATEIYSGQSEAVCITISSTAQNVSRLVIVDEHGKVVAENGGVLKAEDFYKGEDYTRKLYVKALTSTAQKDASGSYDAVAEDDTAADYMSGVKYTSGAKGSLAVNSTNGQITFVKAQAKPVKLSVAAADGSKSKAQSIEVTVQGFSAVALNIVGPEVNVDNEESPTAAAINYDGAMAARFSVYPMVRVNGQWSSHLPAGYFKNLTFKMGKAKKLSLAKNAEHWSIVKTDVASTVSVTDKTNKSVTASYTITQNPAATTKAPKIKALTRLTQQMLDAARASEKQGTIMLKFKINEKNVSAYANQYMMFTPDYTKTKALYKDGSYPEWRRVCMNFLGGYNETSKLVRIDANGEFALPLDMFGKTNEDVIPGSYTLIATTGTYDAGTFKPIAKGTSVKIKIPGKAPKALSMKLKGNFELDLSGDAVNLANGISCGRSWWLENTEVEGNYAVNKIDPETGMPNAFRKYFRVFNDNGVYRLGLNTGLTAAEIESLRENVKDCEGYVTVKSDDQRQDMLIKVTIKDAVMGAAAVDSYAGAETTVQFFANAKSKTPIKLKGVALDASSEGSPSFVKDSKTINALNVVKDGEDSVKIKLGAAEAGKSYKVAFKVLAADSAYAQGKDAAKINEAYVQEKGRLVTATVKIVDPAKVKNSVSIVADDGNSLAFTAYNTATYDAKKGLYSLKVTTKSAIAGGDVSAAKIAETVKNKPYEGTGIVDITKNKEANSFTLTLNKAKFVEKADSKAAGNFKRGKTVDVPVELTFANTNVAAQTVTVKVALPDPLNIDRAVAAAKQAMTDMKAIRVIDMTNMQNENNKNEDPKVTIQNKANAIWNKAVPYDTEAEEITRDFKLTDKKTTGENPVTTWEAALSIKETKKDAEPKWTDTLSYTPEEKITSVAALESAIENLTISNTDDYIVTGGNKLDNNYTADSLRDDVIRMLSKAGVKVPTHLSIRIKNFYLKKATVVAQGKVTADIYVYDAMSKTESEDSLNLVSVIFSKLGDLGVNAKAIEKAVNDTATEGGKVNYAKVIYDTLNGEGSLDDVEGALKEAIETAANQSKTNADVKFEFKALKADGSADATEEDSETVDVHCELPTGADTGLVKFKLVVSQEGMKDYIVDKTTSGITVKNTLKLEADGPDVEVFQKLSEAKSGSTSWYQADGSGILNAAFDPAATAAAEFKPIDSEDTSAIAAKVQADVTSKLTGVGLSAEAVHEKLTSDKAGNIEVDKLVEDASTYAHGTVTVTDSLQREGDTEATYTWTFKYVVEIPQKESTVTATKVTATRKVGNGEAESVKINENAVTINNIGTSVENVIQFTATAEGYWLSDADKTYKYQLRKSDDTVVDGTTTKIDGVTLSETGALTVDPTKITDRSADVEVKVVAYASSVEEEEIASAGSKAYTTTVTLNFSAPSDAATALVDVNNIAVWAKSFTTDKPAIQQGTDDTWVLADDSFKTAVITAAQNWLNTQIGFEECIVSLKDDEVTADGTARKVKFTLNVARGSETATNTALISLDAQESAAQKAIDATADAVKSAADNASLEETGTAASYTKDNAEALMKANNSIKTALGNANLSVSAVSASNTTVTVTFAVDNGTVKSKSLTTEIEVTPSTP